MPKLVLHHYHMAGHCQLAIQTTRRGSQNAPNPTTRSSQNAPTIRSSQNAPTTRRGSCQTTPTPTLKGTPSQTPTSTGRATSPSPTPTQTWVTPRTSWREPVSPGRAAWAMGLAPTPTPTWATPRTSWREPVSPGRAALAVGLASSTLTPTWTTTWTSWRESECPGKVVWDVGLRNTKWRGKSRPHPWPDPSTHCTTYHAPRDGRPRLSDSGSIFISISLPISGNPRGYLLAYTNKLITNQWEPSRVPTIYNFMVPVGSNNKSLVPGAYLTTTISTQFQHE